MASGVLTVHVLRSDTFGNLILDAANEQLIALGAMPGDALTVSHAGALRTARYAATFAEVTPGELLIYEDATRMVALAVNRGSAARAARRGRRRRADRAPGVSRAGAGTTATPRSAARACICAAPARPTSGRASSRSRERHTGRW